MEKEWKAYEIGNPYGQQIVVIGRSDVVRLDIQHGQHHAFALHLLVGRAELAKHFGTCRFVITDVIRMVHDAHAVGLVITDPDRYVACNHTFTPRGRTFLQ